MAKTVIEIIKSIPGFLLVCRKLGCAFIVGVLPLYTCKVLYIFIWLGFTFGAFDYLPLESFFALTSS